MNEFDIKEPKYGDSGLFVPQPLYDVAAPMQRVQDMTGWLPPISTATGDIYADNAVQQQRLDANAATANKRIAESIKNLGADRTLETERFQQLYQQKLNEYREKQVQAVELPNTSGRWSDIKNSPEYANADSATQMKAWDDFSKNTLPSFLPAGSTPEQIKQAQAEFAKSSPRPAMPKRTVLEAGKDAFDGAAIGLAGLVKAVPELTSTYLGFGADAAKSIDDDIKKIRAGMSDKEKAIQADRTKRGDAIYARQDIGVPEKIAIDLWDTIKDFSISDAGAIVGNVIPFILTGGTASALTSAAAARGIITNQAASGITRGVTAGTASIATGGELAGGARDQVMQAKLENLQQSPAYKELAAKGISPEAIRTELADRAAKAAGAVGMVVGAVSGLTGADKLFADKAAGRAATNKAGKVATEIFTEGLEEGGGQYAQSKIAQQYDPTIQPEKGVGQAAALGAIGGGVFGVGGVLATQGSPSAVLPAPITPPAATPQPDNTPTPIAQTFASDTPVSGQVPQQQNIEAAAPEFTAWAKQYRANDWQSAIADPNVMEQVILAAPPELQVQATNWLNQAAPVQTQSADITPQPEAPAPTMYGTYNPTETGAAPNTEAVNRLLDRLVTESNGKPITIETATALAIEHEQGYTQWVDSNGIKDSARKSAFDFIKGTVDNILATAVQRGLPINPAARGRGAKRLGDEITATTRQELGDRRAEDGTLMSEDAFQKSFRKPKTEKNKTNENQNKAENQQTNVQTTDPVGTLDGDKGQVNANPANNPNPTVTPSSSTAIPSGVPVPDTNVQPNAGGGATLATSAAAVQPAKETDLAPDAELDDLNEAIGQAEKAIANVKSISLYSALKGTLKDTEVRDISPNFSLINLRKKGGGGAVIADMVADGTLDAWLAPSQRQDSPTFDEQASTEIIKEAIRNKDYLTFDAKMELAQLNLAARELEAQINELLEIKDVNRQIEVAAAEAREAEQNTRIFESSDTTSRAVAGDAEAQSGARGQDGGSAEALTAPTRADVLAQQDRAASVEALDAQRQAIAENQAQPLVQQTAPDQRTDNTGDMFGLEKAQAEIAKANEGKAKEVDPNQDKMFEATSSSATKGFTDIFGGGIANTEEAINAAQAITPFLGKIDVVRAELPIGTLARYDRTKGIIEISNSHEWAQDRLVEALVEERLHALDSISPSKTISQNAATFMPNGEAFLAAEKQVKENGDFSDFLAYPMKGENYTAIRVAAELFARIGVLFAANPRSAALVFPNLKDVYDVRTLESFAVDERIRDQLPEPQGVGIGSSKDSSQQRLDNLTVSIFGQLGSERESTDRIRTARSRQRVVQALGANINGLISPQQSQSTPTSNPSNPTAIRTAIEGIFSGMKDAWARISKHTVVVDIAADLPEFAEEISTNGQAFFVPSKVKGEQGKIYLIADRITKGQEASVWLHEVFHKRGEELLGKENLKKLYDNVQSWKTRKPDSVERQIYEAAHKRATDSGEYDTEFLTYAIEEAGNRGVTPDASKGTITADGWLAKVKSLFTNALRKLLGGYAGKVDVSANDLMAMAYGAAGLEYQYANVFRDGHVAPGGENDSVEVRKDTGGDFSLAEIAQGFHNQPDDYFDTKVGARYYGYESTAGRESQTAVNNLIRQQKAGKELSSITIYRAVPKDSLTTRMKNGDWVSLSKTYAIQHGSHRFGKYSIIEQTVSPSDVWWDGNDINEFGYDDSLTAGAQGDGVIATSNIRFSRASSLSDSGKKLQDALNAATPKTPVQLLPPKADMDVQWAMREAFVDYQAPVARMLGKVYGFFNDAPLWQSLKTYATKRDALHENFGQGFRKLMEQNANDIANATGMDVREAASAVGEYAKALHVPDANKQLVEKASRQFELAFLKAQEKNMLPSQLTFNANAAPAVTNNYGNNPNLKLVSIAYESAKIKYEHTRDQSGKEAKLAGGMTDADALATIAALEGQIPKALLQAGAKHLVDTNREGMELAVHYRRK